MKIHVCVSIAGVDNVQVFYNSTEILFANKHSLVQMFVKDDLESNRVRLLLKGVWPHNGNKTSINKNLQL